MSIETWGLMPKAQDDSQKIDEAIAEAIIAHEADPEAHLGEGDSLQSHRASEIIDHLAESFVGDKLEKNFFDKTLFTGAWQSLDCFDITGVSTQVNLGAIIVMPTTTLNNIAYAKSKSTYYYLSRMQDNWVMEFSCQAMAGTHGLCYAGTGTPVAGAGEGFVGIKQLNNKLYACTAQDSFANETTTELTGVTVNLPHKIRIEYTHNSHVLFYVDGVLKATMTTNLPNSGTNLFLYIWTQCNNAGSMVGLAIGPVRFELVT